MMPATKIRREARTNADRTKGGKLTPIMAVPFIQGEGGVVAQQIMIELDPIAGRLLTPITAYVVSVFVPTQACDALLHPADEYTGVTEVLRNKLLSGTALFDLETEGELTKRMAIKPIPVSGVKKTVAISRIAHNAAVNYLRKRKYAYAVEIAHGNAVVTPALISQTVLDRLNAVLDPDDRINGVVNLDLPTVNLPVKNLKVGSQSSSNPQPLNDDGTVGTAVTASTRTVYAQGPNTTTVNPIYALFDGVTAGGLSLKDFYDAQRHDELIRQMRAMIEANPVDGEEAIMRWAYGLNMEPGRHPFVVAEQEVIIGQDLKAATDGPSLLDDVTMSKMVQMMNVSAVIPTTELGGVLITFLSVKPDEVLYDQPHPIFSRPWGRINHVAEEFLTDPVPVTMREIDGNVLAGDETDIAFYTGHNALAQNYVDYGFSRRLDPEDIENKSAIWQLAIPASVTPENIIYPETLSHYPFADQLAEVARYTVAMSATINTPLQFGPTPVEDVSIVTTEDLFGEE